MIRRQAPRALLPIAAVLGLALAAACSGPLVSDPAADPGLQGAPTGSGPAPAKPRRSPIEVGDAVPRMTWFDQAGRPVSTTELTTGGDAILVFHPGDSAPETRPVYEWVRRNREAFAGRKCETLLVSPDDPPLNAAVATRETLRCGVLHDRNGWGARAFGFLAPNRPGPMDGVWTVIVGREDRVLAVQRGLMEQTDVITTLVARPGERMGFTLDDLTR